MSVHLKYFTSLEEVIRWEVIPVAQVVCEARLFYARVQNEDR